MPTQRMHAWLDVVTPVPGPPGLPRVIQDEGTALPVRTVIDMRGAGVTATDDPIGDKTIITIPGGTADMVVSVFGRPGPAITAQAGDYNASQVTNAVSILGSYSDPPWITSIDWSKVANEPSSFPPSAHTHPWSEVTSKPVVFPPEAHQHPWGDLTGIPSNVSGAVPNTTQVIAGTGLSGGGALSGNVTISANIAAIQTPWTQNISAAGFALSSLGSVAFQEATGDKVLLYQSLYGIALQSLEMRLFTSDGGGIISFCRRSGGVDTRMASISNSGFQVTGNIDAAGYTATCNNVTASLHYFIPGGSATAGISFLGNAYDDWLQLGHAGHTTAGGVRVYTNSIPRMEFSAAGAVRLFLGGVLKTLSVDGSGFVKAA